MLRSFIITAIIILCNILFFQYGGQKMTNEQWYWSKEILNCIYKIFVYAWPMILLIIFRDRSTLKKIFHSKFKWFSQSWVYLLRIGRLILLLVTKKIWSVEFRTYSLFYVLIVNSIVEETVFRWYIQEKLVARLGKVKWIIGQAILFGVIHLPLYYSYYQIKWSLFQDQ